MSKGDRRHRPLGTILLIVFIAMALLPAIAAAVIGWLDIDATMTEQSVERVTEHGSLALDIANDRMVAQRDALRLLAADGSVVPGRRSPSEIADALRYASRSMEIDYLLVIAPSGKGIASSVSGKAPDRNGDPLMKAAAAGKSPTGFVLVSQAEIDAMGLAPEARIELVPTAAGKAPSGSPAGAIALSAAVPLRNAKGDLVGVLVGAEMLNRSTALVDSIVRRLGGTATVFQDVVRISTTVRNAQGERAIGTWASDPVQAAYANAQPYRGQATVVGNQYMTDYQPITDSAGTKIGMLYVGISLDPYFEARNTFVLRLFAALAVCVVLAALAAFPIARTIVGPVVEVSSAAEKVAAGDLRSAVPLSGSAELVRLGESFNQMTASLAGMISETRHAVTGLRQASTTILSSSEQQTQTVQRQVSAATETTATLEELAVSYRSVASGAEEVLRIAEEALEHARDGQALLEESIHASDAVHEGAGSTADSAHEVAEVSDRIGDVLVLIDSIAEQTKILALNAAIEAARAGEAGKGFAVVAQEIRKLATSVGESTKQIEDMVRAIQSATKRLSQVAEQQAALSEQGAALGHRAQENFADILEQLSSTTNAAREISVASVQQRSAAEQVVMAMQQVTTAATESSTAAAEVSRVARDVDEHGRALDDRIQGFTL